MIVLDTHVLVWSVLDSPRLGQRFTASLESSWAEGAVAVSSIRLLGDCPIAGERKA